MKWNKLLLALALMIFLGACFKEEGETVPTQRSLESRCDQITALYQDLYLSAEQKEPENRWQEPRLHQEALDTMEDRLICAGLDVLDSQEDAPEYLTTGNAFRRFLEQIQQGRDARQEVISIRPSGELGFRLFESRDGKLYVHSMVIPVDGETARNYEMYEVLDWTLTDRGNFYYRLFREGDEHFADYILIRLEKPDPVLWTLNRTYLSAGGYVGSNLFLTDWTEADFAKLSFNDLWEYLYRYEYGCQFDPSGYPYSAEEHCFRIPAAEFEPPILRHFRIETQDLRSLAGFDPQTETYPWRQIQSSDLVSILNYYTMEPEVAASRTNPDGTLTLTVEALSTDLKTDCLFSHELTIRPLENGDFQFVSNRVLSQTGYGLPYCQPRRTWPLS